MRQLTEHEMAVKEAMKVARSFLRLKYSVLADREINERLPEIEARIQEALVQGESFALNPGEFFGGDE